MKRHAHVVTLNFFPDGADLPLLSGAPITVRVTPFNPEPVARQTALFDTRLDPFHVLTSLPSQQEEPIC